MSTSNDRLYARTCRVYLRLSALAAVFSAVYESFSHGVFSAYMVFLFAWPLLGGALPYAILNRTRRAPRAGWLGRCLYHSGIAALAVGSCVQGILEIYGTTSDYMPVYWIVGALSAICGALSPLFAAKAQRR